MAKEQKQEQNPAPAPDATPEAAAPPKSYRLYIILGFVSLILFQMIFLYLILPPTQKVPPGGLPINGDGNFNNVPGIPQDVIKQEDMDEIQIGEKNSFKIVNGREDGTEKFSLIMWVRVRKNDTRNFTRQYEKSMNTIIDRAFSVLYASETEERREAGHTALKERVKKEINNVLVAPWVQEVLFLEVSHEVP